MKLVIARLSGFGHLFNLEKFGKVIFFFGVNFLLRIILTFLHSFWFS